jgi:hypothetical protein
MRSDIRGARIGTGDRTFQLRAERAGDQTDRVYTVVYRATDRSGNWREMSAEVLVPRRKPKETR